MKKHKIKLHGHTLKRGYWLYICDVQRFKNRVFLYVGRTGGFRSPTAGSPWRRMGYHLDLAPRGAIAPLLHHLKKAKIDPFECFYEITALGPIYPKTSNASAHTKISKKMDALETALADRLKCHYAVVGKHPKKSPVDQAVFQEACRLIEGYLL